MAIPPALTFTNSSALSHQMNPRSDRGHRQPVGDQRGRVVHQALALQDGDDDAGHLDAAGDGGGGHGVGRGDDRPQHEPDHPRQAEAEVAHRRHPHGGEQHQPNGQQRDRPQLLAERPPLGVERGGVQERREEREQGQLGRQLVLLQQVVRQPRLEAEDQPADHQQDRVRQPHPTGEDADGRHHRHQDDERLAGGQPMLTGEHGDSFTRGGYSIGTPS
jgi:hypothetical protein